jgi:two-component system, NarL family, sensor kinase
MSILEDVSSGIVGGYDEMHRRVARELHDGALQLLAALSMNMSVLEQWSPPEEGTRGLIADCVALAKECSKQIRTVGESLYPALLDEVGLAAALPHFARAFGESTGCRMEVQVTNEFGRLDRDAEVGIFRMVEALLAGLGAGARGACAEIVLERHSEAVFLRVTCTPSATATAKFAESRLVESILMIRAGQLGGTLEVEFGPECQRILLRIALEASVRKLPPRGFQ